MHSRRRYGERDDSLAELQLSAVWHRRSGSSVARSQKPEGGGSSTGAVESLGVLSGIPGARILFEVEKSEPKETRRH